MPKTEKLKIGEVTLKNKLFLAPMLDVTDLPYRLICRKAGCGMAYTEMVQAESILHENAGSKDKMLTTWEDRPLGLQITAKDIAHIQKVAPLIKKYGKYDLVDLNCGCPSSVTTDYGSGAYLLKEKEKIYGMIRALKENGLVVTAKMRLGFSKNNVIEIAKGIEKAGADGLTVHARLANQSYENKSDWGWIKKVREAVGIPVIGNGDVDSPAKAAEMLEIADGAMIGRAAIGNPLIFENVLHYLRTGKEKEFDFKKNMAFFNEYLKLSEKYGLLGLPKAKRVGAHFIREIKGAAGLRQRLMQLRSVDEIREFVGEF